MKFIHCADIHLDSPFTLASPDEALRRRTELRAGFSSLVLYGKAEGCKLFLISGDLFDDGMVTKDTFELLYREMSSFPDCRFFISPGNHDPFYENSPYTLMQKPDNVHIFSSEKIEAVDIPEENICVYGYAFTSDTMTESPLEGFEVKNRDRINILVAHGEVCSGFSAYCPVYEKDLELSGLDYAALGHIHKASGVKYAGKTPYVYPGCLEGMGFDETGYKGAVLCEITKEKLEIKPVKIAKRRYEIVKCDISGAENTSSVVEKIAAVCSEFGSDTALRIILEGITSESFFADEAVIRASVTKPYYLEIKDNTLPLYNSEHLKTDNTVIGEFYRRIEARLSDEDLKTRETARLALKYGLKALAGRELDL